MASQFTLHAVCKAAPETVYSLLSDLGSHMVWNGERQSKDFRLLSLDSPPAPATVGTVFDSTGAIPFSSRQWHDRSSVTAAERPQVFEFRTNAVVPFQNGDRMEAVLSHRYEIEPAGSGCRVSYTMKLESMRNGMWRLSLPVLRTLMWKVGIPMATRPGLRNLVRMAEAAAASQPNASAQRAQIR